MIRSAVPRRISAFRHRRSFHTNTNNKNYPDEFFNFTRGRFICDEANEMAQRRVKFDMTELCKAAARATGSEAFSNVEKCADGMYNKAFLVTMTDGKQVIAKVPNPNAGRPHFTTASEVATMDFARSVLGIPSPRVLTWSSSTENAVGAEYIIMEKARGLPLEQVWTDLDFIKRIEVVRSIARYLRTCTRISFAGIGSLYYASDLENVDQETILYVDERTQDVIRSTRFAMGPTNGREWVDCQRASLRCNRGPWTSILEYQKAVIQRETNACQQSQQLPKSFFMLCGPNLYQPTTAKKLNALTTLEKILPYIIPTEKQLIQPHIWHDDLHTENIFVDPDNPSQISTIIDWQSVHISPLYNHNLQPALIQFNEPFSQEMERPILIVEDSMTGDEKAAAVTLFYDRSLQFAFTLALKHHIEPGFSALVFKETSAAEILSLSRRIYEIGEAHLMSQIAALRDEWHQLPCVHDAKGNPPFPLHFSEQDLADLEKELEKAAASHNVMVKIQEALGDLFPERGVVRHEQYGEAKARLREVKLQVLEDFARDELERREWVAVWPFDD